MVLPLANTVHCGVYQSPLPPATIYEANINDPLFVWGWFRIYSLQCSVQIFRGDFPVQNDGQRQVLGSRNQSDAQKGLQSDHFRCVIRWNAAPSVCWSVAKCGRFRKGKKTCNLQINLFKKKNISRTRSTPSKTRIRPTRTDTFSRYSRKSNTAPAVAAPSTPITTIRLPFAGTYCRAIAKRFTQFFSSFSRIPSAYGTWHTWPSNNCVANVRNRSLLFLCYVTLDSWCPSTCRRKRWLIRT